MSATVSLRLGTGQLFGDIPIPDTEITLAEFIDATLKDLEVNFSLLNLKAGSCMCIMYQVVLQSRIQFCN